jgi:hypothetical protein
MKNVGVENLQPLQMNTFDIKVRVEYFQPLQRTFSTPMTASNYVQVHTK